MISRKEEAEQDHGLILAFVHNWIHKVPQIVLELNFISVVLCALYVLR